MDYNNDLEYSMEEGTICEYLFVSPNFIVLKVRGKLFGKMPKNGLMRVSEDWGVINALLWGMHFMVSDSVLSYSNIESHTF